MESGLSDSQLVLEAQQGCNKSFDYLLKRYRSFLGFKAKHHFLKGACKEDVFQECLIGFYEAVRDYRIEQPLNFKCFAELCVNRQLMTSIKCADRIKHGPLNDFESLSSLESDFLCIEDADPSILLTLQEKLQKVRIMINRLPELELKVLEMVCQGQRHKVIISELNISYKQVDNALHRVRKKLRKVFYEDDY